MISLIIKSILRHDSTYQHLFPSKKYTEADFEGDTFIQQANTKTYWQQLNLINSSILAKLDISEDFVMFMCKSFVKVNIL